MAKVASKAKSSSAKPRKASGTAKKPKAKPAGKIASSGRKSQGKRVAVLGGGISGLNAALKLKMAGFDVTIYELQERLGGNTSSRRTLAGKVTNKKDGVEHDVYPHMFCSWYENFWDLYEKDLGLKRKDYFEPRYGSKVLQLGETEFKELLNPTSMDAVIKNLKSGVLSPAEMWLLGYAGLDLTAHPFDRTKNNLMDMLSVNGFISSRGYATEDVAEMENYLLTLIWSIPSAWTSAATYQNFLRHTFAFPQHEPFDFLMKSSLQEGLIEPIEKALLDNSVDGQGECTIRTKTEVTAVRIGDDERPCVWSRRALASHLEHDSERAEKNKSTEEAETYDFAVMALPVMQTCDKVVGSYDKEQKYKGKRIVDCVPALSDMQRLGSVSIPVVDLYVNRKLEDFPKDHIALAGSKFGLTVLDISQLWDSEEDQKNFAGKTALILAASNGEAIPSVELYRMGELMIQEFANFFPDFNPGKKWGDEDPKCDVDWDKSWIRLNRQYKLFLNDTGSWGNRPQTLYENDLPRLVFAGDCVQTEVDMATVEGAIQGGTQAAAAVQAQHAVLNDCKPSGDLIRLVPHTTYSTATFRGARLLYLPFTYAAFGVAAYEQWKIRMQDEDHHLGENQYTMAEYMALVPLQFSIDWWKAAYWFGRSLIGSDNADPFGGRITYMPTPKNLSAEDQELRADEHKVELDHKDHVIGLPEALLLSAREVFDFVMEQEDGRRDKREGKGGSSHEPLDDVIDLASSVVEVAFNLGDRFIDSIGKRRPHSGASHRRRWRTKR